MHYNGRSSAQLCQLSWAHQRSCCDRPPEEGCCCSGLSSRECLSLGLVASGLGTEDQVKEVCEVGSSLGTTENDKEETDRIFAEVLQRRGPNPCGAGKEGQLETTPKRSTEWRVLPRGRLGTCGAGGRLLLSCRSAATEQGPCSGKR